MVENPHPPPTTQHPGILAAIKLIQAEYPRMLPAAEMASAAHFRSRSHFSRVFEHEVGIPPAQFLADTRFEEAKRLLRETDDSVLNIAVAVGYSDASALVRLFRDRLDIAPGQYRITVASDRSLSSRTQSRHQKMMNEAVTFMKANLHEVSLGIPEIARVIGRNPRTLVRIFQIEHGVTPSQFLQNLRLEEAARLLRETNHSVSYIAAVVGYSSHTSFGARFEAQYGVTPTTYRKNARRATGPQDSEQRTAS